MEVWRVVGSCPVFLVGIPIGIIYLTFRPKAISGFGSILHVIIKWMKALLAVVLSLYYGWSNDCNFSITYSSGQMLSWHHVLTQSSFQLDSRIHCILLLPRSLLCFIPSLLFITSLSFYLSTLLGSCPWCCCLRITAHLPLPLRGQYVFPFCDKWHCTINYHDIP